MFFRETPLSLPALAALLLALGVTPVSAQTAPVPCAINRDIPVILARQFIETDKVTWAVMAFAHPELLPVSQATPTCKSVSLTGGEYALTYRYAWPAGKEMVFVFDRTGNFERVVQAKGEAAADPLRYQVMQKLIDEGSDALLENLKGRLTENKNGQLLIGGWFEMMKLTPSWKEVTGASTLLTYFLQALAQNLDYGSPPASALDQDHAFLSRYGFFFLPVSPAVAAAIMRHSAVDLRKQMAVERADLLARPQHSSNLDFATRPDGTTQLIPVLDQNADRVTGQDRRQFFVSTSFPPGYLSTGYGADHSSGYLLKLSSGGFGLVPKGEFDPIRQAMMPAANIRAPIPRTAPPPSLSVGKDQFRATLVEHFNDAATRARLDPSLYREEMDYLVEAVETCASLPSAFAQASIPATANVAHSSRWEPWNLVDPRYIRECTGTIIAIPAERVQPVSAQKPRKVVYTIDKSGERWADSSHFRINILFSPAPGDVTIQSLDALSSNYSILTADIAIPTTIGSSLPPPSITPAPPPRPTQSPQQFWAAANTRLAAAGEVVNPRDRLMWTLSDNGRNVNWKEANHFCESTRAGGFTDWRMPASAELAGLYDPSSTRDTTPLPHGEHYFFNGQMAQDPAGSYWKYHIGEGITLTGTGVWSANTTRGDSVIWWSFSSGGPSEIPGGFKRNMRALCVRPSGLSTDLATDQP